MPTPPDMARSATPTDGTVPPPKIVVMGPAGAGKTTVGVELARLMGVPFADADAFHSPFSIEKMRRGHALTDADRAPWLEALAARLRQADVGVVLACSALKQSYRQTLEVGLPFSTPLAYLAVPEEVLRQRLYTRSGHFAGPTLLESQLATLEVPTAAETYDGTLPPRALAEEIIRRTRLGKR